MISSMNYFYENNLIVPDNMVKECPSFYGVFNDELYLWHREIEKILDVELFPTYTYARIYQKNNILIPHTDRSECEISFTMNLTADGGIWPFYLLSNNKVEEILLNPGDICIYNGITEMHWRLALEQDYCYQAFFHFVKSNGMYSLQKYDGKEDNLATRTEIIEIQKQKLKNV